MSKISKKNSPKKCVFDSTSAIESAKDALISSIVEDSFYFVEVFGLDKYHFNCAQEYMKKFNYKFVCLGSADENENQLCTCGKHFSAVFNLKDR